MKTILSIDGGGMKGYIPCSVLAELEYRAGDTCTNLFDMVAGTSIGGILACLISTGTNATDALKFFTEDGPRIFGKQQFFSLGGVFRPRYSGKMIDRCLQERFGKKTLSDCQKKLLVPTFDLKAYEPYFFKSHNTDKPYPLWQVARATSAAQTYFPAFKLDDKILWDGGNAANNPAVCALAEAVRIWGPQEEFKILSLSCGPIKSKLPAKWLVNAGIVRVGMETIGLLFDANDELPDYILKQLMGNGYFRIEPKSSQSVSIDGADLVSLKSLKSQADTCIKDNSNTLNEFLSYKMAKTARFRNKE